MQAVSEQQVAENVQQILQTVRQTALEAGTLYVGEDGDGIFAAVNLNGIQLPEYDLIPWQFEAPRDQVMVIHTLVIRPARSGGGCLSYAIPPPCGVYPPRRSRLFCFWEQNPACTCSDARPTAHRPVPPQRGGAGRSPVPGGARPASDGPVERGGYVYRSGAVPGLGGYPLSSL